MGRPRTLAARIYGVTVAVLVASLGTYATLQARAEAERHRAFVIEGALATLGVASEGLASELLVGDYAGLDEALLRVGELPGLLRLQLCEPDGKVLSDVRHDQGRRLLAPLPAPARLAVPAAGEREWIEVAAGEDRLVVWHAVEAGGDVLAWTRATVDLAPLRAAIRRVWLRALLLAAAAAAASLALLVWVLRRPLGAIGRLAGFARDLPARKGETLSMPPATLEIDQLRDALNLASGELLGGERRLIADAAERRSLEAQLLQAQKMEALGALAGGVAHDFNNLLTAIGGYANLLVENAGAKELRDDAEQILVATERAAVLTRGLLAFSRKQRSEIAPVDLNALVHGSARILERLVGEDVLLQVVPAPSPVVVLADRGQLDQIVMNLAANARDAMPDGGVLSISTSLLTAPPAEGWPGGAAPPAAGCLAVSDTGLGMSEEVLRRMFEPFFTTKGVGRGTGLGLAIVHGIVAQHGGKIEVESRVGKGTTFRILLPATGALAAEVPAAARGEPGVRDTGTVLLVEDDPLVNRVIGLSLERAGYTVHSAQDGRQGLELLRGATASIDLLLTDVIMPEMNGLELLLEARRLAPELPVLLMSGYTADVLERRGPLPAGVELMMKPVTPDQVRARIRAVLAARRATTAPA